MSADPEFGSDRKLVFDKRFRLVVFAEPVFKFAEIVRCVADILSDPDFLVGFECSSVEFRRVFEIVEVGIYKTDVVFGNGDIKQILILF